MIRHLKNDQVDIEKWDECIANAFNGNVYGFSWNLDIVCPGWEALVEDDYLRVFPLPYKQKMHLAYSMQPYFTQQLGVFSRSVLTAGDVAAFLRAIPANFRYIDLNMNVFSRLQQGSWKIIDMANYELDLISDYSMLREGYSQNIRRNIKKSAENSLNIVKNVKPDDLVLLFRNNRGKQFRHLGDEQYAILLRLIYVCIHKGIAQVWGAYDAHNELCAGVVWLFSHQEVIFLFSGLSENGRSKGAMPFLIDSFIREHAGQQLTLNFEGSNDEGLARFYAGFGSEKTTYYRVIINRLPFWLRVPLAVLWKTGNIF
jgi:hypothetical protein